jgi:hypothetical protein
MALSADGIEQRGNEGGKVLPLLAFGHQPNLLAIIKIPYISMGYWFVWGLA